MSETSIDILKSFENAKDSETILKTKFDLDSNPFPKSGIADLDATDEVISKLVPVSPEVTQKIVSYIRDSMSDRNSDNRYLSLVITGEYGTGKTQTLMFIQYLLKHYPGYKPYVVYLDDPGQSLSELIGSVISEIGIENFKRYLWNIFMLHVDDNQEIKNRFIEYISSPRMFTSYSNLSANSKFESCFKSYKELADALLGEKVSRATKNAREEFLLNSIMTCFIDKFKYTNIARYYVGILSENINISKSWDLIVSGQAKDLAKKEVVLLKSIVEIVKNQMDYTDFYLLVDEFEEVSSNRLTKKEADNYMSNLRALIDRERNWCSVFAMNPRALEDVKQISLALFGRISNSTITLTPFDANQLGLVIKNYIDTVRKNNDSIYPFTDAAVQTLYNGVEDENLKGSPRYLLKLCYSILQDAAVTLDKGQSIDEDFVKSFLNKIDE